MIWLADENIPVGSILRLRNAELDLASIRETRPGLSDAEVLQYAYSEQRGLLTFDRDFGELLFVRSFPCPPAVVYFRFVPLYPEEPAEVFLTLLGSAELLEGAFVVLDRDGLRKRRLPER